VCRVVSVLPHVLFPRAQRQSLGHFPATQPPFLRERSITCNDGEVVIVVPCKTSIPPVFVPPEFPPSPFYQYRDVGPPVGQVQFDRAQYLPFSCTQSTVPTPSTERCSEVFSNAVARPPLVSLLPSPFDTFSPKGRGHTRGLALVSRYNLSLIHRPSPGPFPLVQGTPPRYAPSRKPARPFLSFSPDLRQSPFPVLPDLPHSAHVQCLRLPKTGPQSKQATPFGLPPTFPSFPRIRHRSSILVTYLPSSPCHLFSRETPPPPPDRLLSFCVIEDVTFPFWAQLGPIQATLFFFPRPPCPAKN